MMPVRGQENVNLPYQVLTSRDGIYFSSIVLSMWDNIHGPKILMTWKGSESKLNAATSREEMKTAGTCGYALLVSPTMNSCTSLPAMHVV